MNTIELEVAWEVCRTCILWLGPHASNTRFTEFLNIYRHEKPSIFIMNKF